MSRQGRVDGDSLIRRIRDRSQSIEEADFLPSVLGPYVGDVLRGHRPLILFGAGSAGQDLYPVFRLHGVSPVCFGDSDPARAGQEYCGIPVLSSREVCREFRDGVVFVTSNRYCSEIRQSLMSIGVKPELIRSVEEDRLFFLARFFHYHSGLEELESAEESIQQAFELLSDERSRDLFLDRMAMFAQGADYGSFRAFLRKHGEAFKSEGPVDENYLYFNNDVMACMEQESLLDAGAYSGDSVNAFVEWCRRSNKTYRAVWCFEPDDNNYRALLENTSEYPNVRCYKRGLWNEATTLRFLSSSKIQSFAARVIRGTGDTEAINPQTGDVVIETVRFDDVSAGEPISIVKMDVEGAETEALLGCCRTIQAWSPRLAISAYHRRQDLYELPLVIERIRPGYRMYLRHLGRGYSDTVLFAVP